MATRVSSREPRRNTRKCRVRPRSIADPWARIPTSRSRLRWSPRHSNDRLGRQCSGGRPVRALRRAGVLDQAVKPQPRSEFNIAATTPGQSQNGCDARAQEWGARDIRCLLLARRKTQAGTEADAPAIGDVGAKTQDAAGRKRKDRGQLPPRDAGARQYCQGLKQCLSRSSIFLSQLTNTA